MPTALDVTWNHIRASLRDALGATTYQLWIEPLTLEGGEGDRLVLGAPKDIRAWVADRYGRTLQAAAVAVLGPSCEVEVVAARGAGAVAAEPAVAASSRRRPAVRAEAFNPRYTFEQFILGEANRFAHAAALAVAELPGQAYNPLFLYGPPGLGKTHLLNAIANYLAAHEPSRVVRLTTAESFTNHFLGTLADEEDRSGFKALYREADVLLIDDVQFLERKVKTTEELFHTFAELYEGGAQLVLTSDRPPRDLAGLEDRLRERFAAGLVSDLERPDLATRLAFLRKRAALDCATAPEEAALEVIAARVTESIRALEGALVRVVALASLEQREADAELAGEVLDAIHPQAARPVRPSITEVVQATCEAFGLTPEELLSSSRAARVAWPRQVAMYLAREHTDLSLPAIGRAFGGRDHTTVLYACRRAAARRAGEPGALEAIGRVSSRLADPGGVRPA